MNQPVTLVFDLDGTISDPLIGIHRCVNHALAWGGFDNAPEDAVARLIGPPLDEVFRALARAADEQCLRQLVDKYRERYLDVGYGYCPSRCAHLILG